MKFTEMGAVALFASALMVCSCTSTKSTKSASWASDAMQPRTQLFDTEAQSVYENVAYATLSPSQVCDIYLPEKSGILPVIALVHGGGFAFQNQRMPIIEKAAKFAVKQGYAVVSIDYRKSSEAVFPAALSDVKAAVRFIRANADKYGFDTNRITIWGESAGAYLSIMTALTPSVKELDGDVQDNTGFSSAVNNVVDFYGPIEFYTMDAEFEELGFTGTKTSESNSFESKFLGQAVGEDKEATYRTYWESYKDSVPTALKAWIQAGTADKSVPPTQSKNLATRLADVIGAENVNYSTIDGAKHMDSAFYTDDNLSRLFEFLSNSEIEYVAKLAEKWETEASQGHSMALVNLGLLYEHKEIPASISFFGDIPLDYVKAADYFTRATEAGNMKAPRHLGLLYQSGVTAQDGTILIAKDTTKAVELFKLAAERGDSTGTLYYADALMSGEGVEKDEEAARSLYQKLVNSNAHDKELAKERLSR